MALSVAELSLLFTKQVTDLYSKESQTVEKYNKLFAKDNCVKWLLIGSSGGRFSISHYVPISQHLSLHLDICV
uniref:Dynein light chain n=1 Tax=Heterorhabditis bacteriophora TaxID=37862 RepID=A0A1I7WW46_HETBA